MVAMNARVRFEYDENEFSLGSHRFTKSSCSGETLWYRSLDLAMESSSILGDLEEFCEKHYEKLLPIMTDKYEYEKRKKKKLEEVKARLDFGDARKKSTRAQESAYSESRTISQRQRRLLLRKYYSEVKIVKAALEVLNLRRKKSNVEDVLSPTLAAATTESWAATVSMFNSTLTGNARVWFDDLPPESIDSYNDLREAFLFFPP
ncbi:hypothetical protein Tco_1192864 [Tanacetum coccineum]